MHRMISKTVYAGVFVISIAIFSHFLFSAYSFVPTDDGFLLAYGKRILDGQMPHRDFLSAHNLGTPLLFAPFILYGGDYVIWLTRFVVWFEFAFIAWAWAYVLAKKIFTKKQSWVFLLPVSIIAFYFTAHSHPLMVWYTIDGLFFYTLGLLFCLNSNKRSKAIGYFLIGFTFIIKQNFVFLIPGTLLILNDWRQKKYWLYAVLPSMMYYSFFLFTGNIYETILQTTSRTEFFQTAVKAYWSKFTVPWGIILGFIGIYQLKKKQFLQFFIWITSSPNSRNL